MNSTPGSRTPGERPRSTQTVEALNVAIDATGQTELGTLIADESVVREVRVDSSAQDFDFNITHNGNNLFANEQSPTNAQEDFTPNQNRRDAGQDDAELAVDISAASGTTGATADIQVLVDTRHRR